MTTISALRPAAQTKYEVHIPAFQGPLGLLLQLIEKNELDITKVALAQVTDEFMERVDQMREHMQIEVVADFLAVAAKLLLIKSKALLPKPPASAKEIDDEDDVGDELIRQLRAYRQFKEAASWLRDRDEEGLRSYIRVNHTPRPKRVTVDLGGTTVEELYEAARAAIFPTDMPRPEGAIQRPRISIVHQVELIRKRLTHWAQVTFSRLLSRTPSRLEAVVTLQAILELMKQRTVVAHQEQMFGDITVKAIVPPEQIGVTGTGDGEATGKELALE
jgi:segregation and condensation protein A